MIWILEAQAFLISGLDRSVKQEARQTKRRRRRREDGRLNRIIGSRTLQWANNTVSDLLISRIILNGKHFNDNLLLSFFLTTRCSNAVQTFVGCPQEDICLLAPSSLLCLSIGMYHVLNTGKIPLTYDVLKSSYPWFVSDFDFEICRRRFSVGAQSGWYGRRKRKR
jgi:hypothetical protein